MWEAMMTGVKTASSANLRWELLLQAAGVSRHTMAVPEQDALLEAALRQGVQTCLHVSRGDSGVRGLYAATDVPACANLMSCPASLALTMPYSDSAFAAPYLLREVLHLRCQQQQQQQHEPAAQAGTSATADSGPKPHRPQRRRCRSCGSELWRPRMTPEFLHSLPQPGDLLTGYLWPEETIPLLACPDLEAVVRLLKRRAGRVYSTGLQGGALPHATCRGALFPLTLAQAELQANGLCPTCTPPPTGHLPPPTRPAPTTATDPSNPVTQPLNGPSPTDLSATPLSSAAGVQSPAAAGSSGAGGALLGGLCVASVGDVEWAASLVCSRTFHSTLPSTMVMVTLLDMVNHTDEHTANACIQSSSESSDESASSSSDESDQDDDDDGNASPHVLDSLSNQLSGVQLQGDPQPAGQQAAAAPQSSRSAGSGPAAGAQQAPLAWMPRYNRCNSIRSRRPIRKDEEVTFTYHEGLRDDEVLIYYGFMEPLKPHPPSHPPPSSSSSRTTPSSPLCAVDHHLYCRVALDPEDQELYDLTGSQLVIDPLAGPWRDGTGRPLHGSEQQLQRELQRLKARLSEHTAMCEALEGEAVASRQAQAACCAAGMPWMVDLLTEFRRRRGVSLEVEITRLEALINQQPTTDTNMLRQLAAQLRGGRQR